MIRNIFLLLPVFAIIGCGDGAVRTELAEPDKRLSAVAMAYTDATQPNGNGPANLDQLKKALVDAAPVTKIDPDKALISPNDNEPFVIIWNVKLSGGTPIVAYEKKGKDGKRLVVDLRRIPYSVTQEEFAKLNFPAGHKPE